MYKNSSIEGLQFLLKARMMSRTYLPEWPPSKMRQISWRMDHPVCNEESHKRKRKNMKKEKKKQKKGKMNQKRHWTSWGIWECGILRIFPLRSFNCDYFICTKAIHHFNLTQEAWNCKTFPYLKTSIFLKLPLPA